MNPWKLGNNLVLNGATLIVAAMGLFGDTGSVGHGITACERVAIVPHHSPFMRAYELSESLCQSAKRTAREYSSKHHQAAAFIDWHIGLPKPSALLSEVREREYLAPSDDQAKPLKLTSRPYELGTSVSDTTTGGKWGITTQHGLPEIPHFCRFLVSKETLETSLTVLEFPVRSFTPTWPFLTHECR